jgi:hypothetical protein
MIFFPFFCHRLADLLCNVILFVFHLLSSVSTHLAISFAYYLSDYISHLYTVMELTRASESQSGTASDQSPAS